MRRIASFVPFIALAVIHIAALACGAQQISGPTKWLLMPALAIALFVNLPRRRAVVGLWAGLALLFSWIGDVLLGIPGGIGFIIGLGSFALARATYVVLFRGPLRRHRMPWYALLYVPWWIALLVFLGPHLGDLLVPVGIYGAVLALSAATALGTNRVVAIGTLVFLLSDTVLAFKLFYPSFALVQQDAIIMLGYLSGQGLIVLGTLRQVAADVSRQNPLDVAGSR
ncbi:MAG: lysoplasmalogenase [Rhodoglobus sp.]